MQLKSSQPRLRIFAGPNGSGKSTMIESVRGATVDGQSINFGIYINADDIADSIRKDTFSFSDYALSANHQEFLLMASSSGLVNKTISLDDLNRSISIDGHNITLLQKEFVDPIAQILADFIRKKLIERRERFSFETVFSHVGKVEFLKNAEDNDYKIYLYYIATTDPAINIERVKARVLKGGHDVPKEKIISRYYRSLELLYPALQFCYKAFFFDNSDSKSVLFASYQKNNTPKLIWEIDKGNVPIWFRQYCPEFFKEV